MINWGWIFNYIYNENISIQKKDQLAKKYGYPFEKHRVITQDGYILELHRIPRGRNDFGNFYKRRTPVLLMHGLGGSSADWILMGPGNSLGK